MLENVPIHNQRIFKSIITLSNANELVSSVIHELAGDLIGTRIKGVNLTSSIINTLAQSRFRQHLKGLKNDQK